MTSRSFRNGVFTALLLASPIVAFAADRSPGLLVKLYELDQSVAFVPDLAPGQTPSDIVEVATLNLTEPFGSLREGFLSEVEGFIKIAAAGQHEFRLTCDDGGLLYIGGKLVVNHDGLHGPTPKDGEIMLSPGDHSLRVRHFQGGGGAALKLEWKTPGASGFALVPQDVLSHESGQFKVEKGKKKIVPPLRRGKPGDGTPVAGIHPGFERLGRAPSAIIEKQPISGTPIPPQYATSPSIWLPYQSRMVCLLQPSEFSEPVSYAVDSQAGELWRCSLELVGEKVQGAAFRNSSGIPAGLGRVRETQDGMIAIDRIASAGGAEEIVALKRSNRSVFEMATVRAMSNGLEIELTSPLDPRCGWEADGYYIEQWPFALVPDGAAGGIQSPAARAQSQLPARDGVQYPVKSASVSDDRRRVFLEIEHLKPSRVVYVRLLPPFISESGEPLWSTEAWYSMITIPKDRAGQVRTRPPQPAQNVLTDAEKAEGWRLLFDGKTTAGWHMFGKPAGPLEGWSVIDGCLVRTGPGGDICTDDEFENFELKIDWRVSPAGNSGIFYGVSEAAPNRWPWETGPECQVLDNAEHADGRSPLTSAGSLYALIPPPKDVTRPVGFFNECRIVVKGDHVEHWLNGEKLLEYQWGSAEWKSKVAASKFKDMPRYGTVRKGKIDLQDHGDRVWFRNIKIREAK